MDQASELYLSVSLPSGTKLGRYEILSPIGAGGMGVVYRAKDLQLGREVAIKVLPENLAENKTALKRLEREARAVASLSHPNILDIHDFGYHGSTAYVVTELLEGRNLKSIIQRSPLPNEEAIKIALSIAEGLHAAHLKGVIHRDLKPDNIFITSDSRVKILDFGLALLKPILSSEELSVASTSSGISNEGVVNGTVPYMSPEQLRGKAVDARSDIFSFGCVLYEMIMGHPLFLRESAADSVAAILREDPLKDSETGTKLSPAVTRVLRMCLEKNPAQRLPDAHYLVSALNEAITGSGMSAALPEKRQARPHAWKFVGLIAALFLIAALTAGYLKERLLPPSSRQIRSLVVLPLRNISGNPQDEYFVDGVTEEITSRLARIGSLRIISRTSAMHYKESQKSLKQIADELDVDAVLEGSFRRIEGRIRLVTNLIQADSDRNIWSQSYDQEIQDIISLQNELAFNVARELKTKLTADEHADLTKTQSILPEAYDAYLRGLSHERREDYSKESLLKEINFFRQAVQLEPVFALAYTSLSQVHSVMHHFHYEPDVNHSGKAKDAINRALEIEPDLPEAILALGYYYYWCLKDYDRALEQFGIARKVLPNNTKVLEGIAYIQRRQGNCEQALNALKKALLLSPRDLRIVNEVANTLSMMRQYQEADNYYEQAITLAPDQISAYLYKAENYFLWYGRTDRAIALFQRLPQTSDKSVDLDWFMLNLYSRDYKAARQRLESADDIFDDQAYFIPKEQFIGLLYQLSNQPKPAHDYYQKAREILEINLREKPRDPRILSSLGLVYAGLGLHDQAIEKGKLGVQFYPAEKDRVEGVFRIMDLAKIYVMIGKYDAALDHLEQILSKPGFVSIQLLQLDPVYEPLHRHPRFLKLVREHSGPPKQS